MSSKLNASTVVTTAEGDVLRFSGWVSKLIVAHPRWAVAITAVAAAIVGHLV